MVRLDTGISNVPGYYSGNSATFSPSNGGSGDTGQPRHTAGEDDSTTATDTATTAPSQTDTGAASQYAAQSSADRTTPTADNSGGGYGVSWNPDTGSFVDNTGQASTTPAPDYSQPADAGYTPPPEQAPQPEQPAAPEEPEAPPPPTVYYQKEADGNTYQITVNADGSYSSELSDTGAQGGTPTGLEMPDPNNPGQFMPWAPAPPQAGLAQSDYAGTGAVPRAQYVADAMSQPTLDQTAQTYVPGGYGTPLAPGQRQPQAQNTPPWLANPNGGQSGPRRYPQYGYGGPGGFGGSINVSPNISPYFNNAPVFYNYGSSGGGGGGGSAAPKITPTGTSGRGYYGSMASASPDAWYALQSPDRAAADRWGYYPVPQQADNFAQPQMDATNQPWHPVSEGDAANINTALGVPGY